MTGLHCDWLDIFFVFAARLMACFSEVQRPQHSVLKQSLDQDWVVLQGGFSLLRSKQDVFALIKKFWGDSFALRVSEAYCSSSLLVVGSKNLQKSWITYSFLIACLEKWMTASMVSASEYPFIRPLNLTRQIGECSWMFLPWLIHLAWYLKVFAPCGTIKWY